MTVAPPPRIVITGQGATSAGAVPCAAGRTILSASLQAGLGFPYECASGGCGACRYELLQGSVETLWDEAPGLSARDRKKGNRHLACQTRPHDDVVIGVTLDSKFVPTVPVRCLRATVESLTPLTHDIVELRLRTDAPARFVPGQFVLLGDPTPEGVRRAYSMAGQPNDAGLWSFYLKRVPGGRFTTAVIDILAMGTSLAMEGPFGLAVYRPQPLDVLCIAGGSGLAPMVSVAHAALDGSGGGHVHLFYGGRTQRDLVTPIRFGLPQPNGRFSFTAALSAEPDGGWIGPRGLIHEVVEAGYGDRLIDREIFTAGPPPMVEAVVRMLLARGVQREHIHFDAFY